MKQAIKWAASKTAGAGLSTLAVSVWLAVPASADVITFDTLSHGDTGSTIRSYLAGYGVSVTGVYPSGTDIYAMDDRIVYGGSDMASSGHMYLGLMPGIWGVGYTLNFNTPLTSLAFTRIRELPVAAYPEWSATVYQGGTAFETVGEAAYSLWSGSNPAHTYTFTGAGITSVTFSGNAYGFAAFCGPLIDDIVLNSVPEPGQWAMMGLTFCGVAGYLIRRRNAAV